MDSHHFVKKKKKKKNKTREGGNSYGQLVKFVRGQTQ